MGGDDFQKGDSNPFTGLRTKARKDVEKRRKRTRKEIFDLVFFQLQSEALSCLSDQQSNLLRKGSATFETDILEFSTLSLIRYQNKAGFSRWKIRGDQDVLFYNVINRLKNVMRAENYTLTYPVQGNPTSSRRFKINWEYPGSRST
jgi:hypothetical protein